jgi:hypothetical protein
MLSPVKVVGQLLRRNEAAKGITPLSISERGAL